MSDLTDEERVIVGETSARRAALELQGAAAFTVVTQALIDLRADTSLVDLAAHAIGQELRHSQIYLELAARHAPTPPAPPRIAPIDPPAYEALDRPLARVLQVVGMCSVNETMACGFLELCLDGATDRVVRAGLREVLADEVNHARIGWALLASPIVGERERRSVGQHLGAMVAAQLALWRAQIATLPERAVPSHGCPSRASIADAMMRALRELVIPGFDHVGVDASSLCRAFVEAP